MLNRSFGNSKDFKKAAAIALTGSTNSTMNVLKSVEAAYQVAGCDYECGTNWGSKVSLTISLQG